MSQDFGDLVNDLWESILANRGGLERDTCIIYLRSSAQKLLFAEKRLESLTDQIKECAKRFEDKRELDLFYIEMNFDHCVSSLRSSLEHLAQLINAVIPLNLSPRFAGGETPVTLRNVIKEMQSNRLSISNETLACLSSFLISEIEKRWYKELNELRTEIFHEKFNRFAWTSLATLNRKLLDFKILVPNGTAKSLKTESEREVSYFCKNMVQNVDNVLRESFFALIKYLR